MPVGGYWSRGKAGFYFCFKIVETWPYLNIDGKEQIG